MNNLSQLQSMWAREDTCNEVRITDLTWEIQEALIDALVTWLGIDVDLNRKTQLANIDVLSAEEITELGEINARLATIFGS